jgi:competence protein ComEA
MNKTWWWQSAFIIVGVLFGVGILFLISRPPRGDPIQLIPAPTESPIMVYVSGAVGKSGLYSFPMGSRVNDAIQAAGGFTENADINFLNLAKLLEDGEQVIVPELISPGTSGSQSLPNYPLLALVNINTATLEQLDTLPEIGPKTAQNIIDYRNANGPFTKIEDVLKVPDVGPATFENIKDLITIGMSP